MRKFIPKEPHLAKYSVWAKTHWWNVGRYSIIPSFVIREVKKIKLDEPHKLCLLDIGTGDGEMLLRLSDHFTVFGIDSNKKAIQLAQKKNLVVLRGNARRLPYYKEPFDVITAFDLLEYIPDDIKTLRHWRSRLKEKGLLFLSVPAHQWMWGVDDIIAGHQRRYSSQELKEKLLASGFQIRKMTYFNFWCFPFVAIVKLWKRFRLNLDKVSDEELFANFGFHIGNHAFLNSLLTRGFSSEALLIRHLSLPFGVSLIVCAQKT